MPDQGLPPQRQIPDGERDIQMLTEGGYKPNEIAAYKEQTTRTLLEGGYKADEINDYWGDKNPTASTPTSAAALASSALSYGPQLLTDVTDPFKGARGALASQLADDLHHGNTSMLDKYFPDVANYVRGGKTAFDVANAIWAGSAGAAINAITAPASRAYANAGGGMPQLTIDLKSPTSNILDPTQWTAHASVVRGEEAAGEANNIAGGLAGIFIGGGEMGVGRASMGARSAAMEAFKRGEIKDPSLFPQAVTGTAVSARVRAQFPHLQDYGKAAQQLMPHGSADAIGRVAKNMMDIWVSTGHNPAEIVAMARRDPAVLQQVLAQDVNGQPVHPTFTSSRPSAAADFHPHQAAQHPAVALAQQVNQGIPTQQEGEAGEVAGAVARRGPPVGNAAHTAGHAVFTNSPDAAANMIQDLEHSPDFASGAPQVSRTKAVGHFQVEPGTARQYGFDPLRLGDHDYNDMVGRAIVGHLYQDFGGNMEAIAIGYNDGPGRAQKWLHAGPGTRLVAIRDNNVRSGWRYEREASVRDEAFLPMETQEYVARARFKMGGKEEPTLPEGEKPREFPSWNPDSVPQSMAEEEARSEAMGGGSLSAASRWEHATPEDVTKEIHSNLGEQPRGEVFPDYMHVDRMLTDMVSGLTPFKQADKLLQDEKVMGDPEKDFTTRNAFQQINGASSRMSAFITDGVVQHNNFDYRVIPGSPSIVQSFKDLKSAGGTRDEWLAYMLAKRTTHAATRDLKDAQMGLAKALKAQRDKPGVEADSAVVKWERQLDAAMKKPGVDTGINPFASKRVDTDPYWKKYEKPTETYQGVKSGVLQYAVDTGRLSEKAKAAMEWGNPIHISMQRTGFDTSRAGFAKLEGSDRKLVSDPFAADMDNMQWMIRQSDRNAAINYLIQRASASPTAMARLGLKKVADTAPDENEIDAALKQFGFAEEDMDKAHEMFGTIVQDRMDERLKPNQFTRYVNGKREVWETADPYLAKAIRGANTKLDGSVLVKAANLASDIERAGITVGPDWAWAFGAIHQGSQFVNDALHPLPVVTVLNGWFHMMLDDDIAKRTAASGALNASMADIKGDYLKHLMTDLDTTGTTGLPAMAERLKDLWRDEKSAPMRWNTVMWPVQFSRMLTELVDEGNRTGLMAQGMKKGMMAGKAGARARATGLDFQDTGLSEVSRLLVRASPMYQGYLKGTEQWTGALKNHPIGTTVFAASTLGTATFINTALNILQDNDPSIPENLKYRQIPLADRDRYFISPLINGQRIHVRRPPGALGFVFGGFMERYMNAMLTHDPDAFRDVLSNFLSENFRIAMPAILVPPIEAMTKFNFYTGQQLIPAHVASSAPQDQVMPSTSKLSQKVARTVDTLIGTVASPMQFSPIQMDHLIQGWTGNVGRALVNDLDGTVRPGPPQDIFQTPGLSRIFERNPGLNPKALEDYYVEKQRFDAAFSSRMNARREAKGAKYAEWIAKGALGNPPNESGLVDPDLQREAMADAAYARADAQLNKVSQMLGVQKAAVESFYSTSKLDDPNKMRYATSITVSMIKEADSTLAQMRKFEKDHPYSGQ